MYARVCAFRCEGAGGTPLAATFRSAGFCRSTSEP
nr:MAG TPA: hypothetical protein [Caudoviricetes sp.]